MNVELFGSADAASDTVEQVSILLFPNHKWKIDDFSDISVYRSKNRRSYSSGARGGAVARATLGINSQRFDTFHGIGYARRKIDEKSKQVFKLLLFQVEDGNKAGEVGGANEQNEDVDGAQMCPEFQKQLKVIKFLNILVKTYNSCLSIRIFFFIKVIELFQMGEYVEDPEIINQLREEYDVEFEKVRTVLS